MNTRACTYIPHDIIDYTVRVCFSLLGIAISIAGLMGAFGVEYESSFNTLLGIILGYWIKSPELAPTKSPSVNSPLVP